MERSFKIKSFQVEIELDSEKEFHSLSNQLFSLLRDSFAQRLQSRLNAIENKENIRFDKIELDIGQIDPLNLNKSLDAIINKLISHVNTQIRQGQFEKMASPDDTLLYFAQRGRLPWGSDDLNNLINNQLKDISPKLVEDLKKALTKNIIYFSRIFDHLDKANKVRLKKYLLKGDYPFFMSIVQFFEMLHANLKKEQLLQDFNSNWIQFELLKQLFTLNSKQQVFSEVFAFYINKYRFDKEFVFYKVKAILKQNTFDLPSLIKQYFEVSFKKFKKQSETLVERSDQGLNQLEQYFLNGDEFIQGKLELEALRTIFRQQLKSNSDALMALLRSPFIQKEKLQLFRLVHLLDASSVEIVVKKITSDASAKKIIQLVKTLPSSIFIQKLHQQKGDATFASVKQLMYSFLFKEELKTISTKKIDSFFYKKLAQQFELSTDDFIIGLYVSFFQKGLPEALQQSLERDYLDAVSNKIKKSETLKFSVKHLIDSKDELSLIKLFSKKSIETSLLKNLDKEFSSFQLTQFQQSIITHLYPYFILLLDKKLFKKQLPKPKPLLKLLLKQVQKEKSEDLKKITEQILIAIEKESEIGVGDLSNELKKIIKQKGSQKRIDFQLLSALNSNLILSYVEDKKIISDFSDPNLMKREEDNIISFVRQSNLNYFQTQLISYLIDQFSVFRKDTDFKKAFPNPIDFTDFLVQSIKQQTFKEDIGASLFDLVERIGKETKTPITKWTLRINKSKVKQKSFTDLDQEWLALFSAEVDGSLVDKKRSFSINEIQSFLRQTNLNYFQTQLISYLIDQFSVFRKDTDFKKAFPNPIDFTDFLVQSIKQQTFKEDIGASLFDLVERIGKETKTPITKWTLRINKSKVKQKNFTEFDIEWLALFIPDDVVSSSNQMLDKRATLNFFENSILNYSFSILKDIISDESIKKTVDTEDSLVEFLYSIITKSNSKEFDLMIEEILDNLTKISGVEKRALQKKMVQKVNKRKSKIQLDYRFLFLYDADLSSESKEKEVDRIINKELTFFQKRAVEYLFDLIAVLKKTAPSKKVFFEEKEWIQNFRLFTENTNSENFSQTVVKFVLDQIKNSNIDSNKAMVEILNYFSDKKRLSPVDGSIISYLFDILLEDPKALNTPKIISAINNFGELILNLLSNLPASKVQFEKLILFPNVLNQFTDSQLNKLFGQLSTNKKNQFQELINSFLMLIPTENKAVLKNRLLIFALRILIVDKNINADTFLTRLIEYVSLYDPASLSKSNLKQELNKLITKEPTANEPKLEELLFKIQKEKLFDDETEGIKEEVLDFEILLSLKNQKVIKGLKKPLDHKAFTLRDFEKIIAKKENFLNFLTLYLGDNEILLSFAQISFRKMYQPKVESLIRKSSKIILAFEEELKKINREEKFSRLAPEKFALVLRIFVLKQLPKFKKTSSLKEEQLAFDFANFLSKERYLDSQKMVFWNDYISDQKTIQKIAYGFSLFNDTNVFTGINQRSKNEIFFKDLVFYFLKTDKIPHWAESKGLEIEEALAYVKDRIGAKDNRYVLQLFSEPKIAQRLAAVLSKESVSIQKQILSLLENPSASLSVQKVYETTLQIIQMQSLDSARSNDQWLFDLIVEQQLWKNTNTAVVIESIHQAIKKRIALSQIQFIEKFNAITSIPETYLDYSLKQNFSKAEIESLLYFYLEKGNVPVSLQSISTKILTQLKRFVENDIARISEYFIANGVSIEKITHLFKLLSEKKWIDLVTQNYFAKERSLLLFFEALIKAIQQTSTSEKANFQLYVKLYTSILTRSQNRIDLIHFLTYLKLNQVSIYNQLYKTLVALFRAEEISPSSIIGENMNKKGSLIKISELEKNLPKNDFLELLDYYMVFGSLEEKSQHLSEKDLKNILSKLLKTNLLPLRKKLFQWASSKESVARFLNLYPEEDKTMALDLIHPEFTLFLEQMKSIFQKYLNIDLYRIAQFQSYDDLVYYLLKYWSSSSLSIDHPNRILQQLVDEIILTTSYSKISFFGALLSLLEELKNEEELEYVLDLQRNYEALRTPEEEQLVTQPTPTDFDENDNLYVDNAGLVILWPFLFQLFNKLNLVSKKEFKDDDSLQKAIILTQYLCTGRDEIKENDLILNKLICGAPLNQYVNLEIRLEAFEKEICESLLNGVIKNWEKIGNTSVEGLRETFLMREGVLRKTEENYSLFVKKMPFDVLLSTIPWNISMVQNAFMKYRIIVDWN